MSKNTDSNVAEKHRKDRKRYFVRPDSPTSFSFGNKAPRGEGVTPRPVAHPGDEIWLTDEERAKLVRKGFAKHLCKTIPKVVVEGGEDIDDDTVSFTTKSKKKDILAALDELGVDYNPDAKKAELIDIYEEATAAE